MGEMEMTGVRGIDAWDSDAVLDGIVGSLAMVRGGAGDVVDGFGFQKELDVLVSDFQWVSLI